MLLLPSTPLCAVQTHNFVSEEILRMEPDEGLEKLADALKVCYLYRDTFFAKKVVLQPYFKEKSVVEWDFDPNLIFSRFNRFIDQLKMIEVSHTVLGTLELWWPNNYTHVLYERLGGCAAVSPLFKQWSLIGNRAT